VNQLPKDWEARLKLTRINPVYIHYAETLSASKAQVYRTVILPGVDRQGTVSTGRRRAARLLFPHRFQQSTETTHAVMSMTLRLRFQFPDLWDIDPPVA
jgi:hypothetical protein